ncbi:hypothetical protein [Alienimonas sp. DA493]|uniref:hypothetical protein n=1 Tax=Alienimonas sp. DA493 TaxID=3373605 RepID=UPI0037548682
MSRYATDDRDGWAGGFEDPRFANGRRPDDDNEGFDNVFGGSPRGGGRRFGCGCFLTLLGLGAVAAVVCCGGLAWFGMQDRANRVAAALDNDPAFRGPLEEALGPGYRLTPDPAATVEAPPGAVAYEAVGERGSGRLTVRARRDRDVDPEADPRAVTPLSGTLILDDGRTIELPVEAPSLEQAVREQLDRMRERLEDLQPQGEEAPTSEEGPNGDEPAGELQIDQTDASDAGDH